MAIYFLVFGVLFKRGTPDYVPFLFVGLIPWRWLSGSVQRGASSILNARSLMQQVYLPKIVLPTVSILSNAFKFLIVFLILITYLMIEGYRISTAYFALPLVIVAGLLWISALTFVFAAVVPFFPDLRIILDNMLRLVFFVSGIFFELRTMTPEHQSLLRLNPFAVLVEAFRDILLRGNWPLWEPLLLGSAASVIVIAVGWLWIARNDCIYPKLGY
jgi:lipopolysaccharide transport system permease protein